MPHAFMYHGSFEVNHAQLKPGAKTFKGTDGAVHELQTWPAEVDGVRVSYMEKAGKRFAAVRVQDAKADIILKNEVLLDTQVHLGRGKRFGAEPTVIVDEPMLLFLSDAIRKNPDQARELEDVRARMRAS